MLRLFEQRHIALNMVIALPSLDGIKRAVEMKLGVALLPRRCAITEIASGRLVAVPVAGISRRRQVTLVCRKAHRSHAANAFLAVAQENEDGTGDRKRLAGERTARSYRSVSNGSLSIRIPRRTAGVLGDGCAPARSRSSSIAGRVPLAAQERVAQRRRAASPSIVSVAGA